MKTLKGWVEIEWVNHHQKAAAIGRLVNRLSTVHGTRWGREVSDIGAKVVESAVMDGGVNKTKKGGPRVRTWEMHSSIDAVVEFSPKGQSISAMAGFIYSPPKWAIFQERGTLGRRIDSKNPRTSPTTGRSNTGIPPMLAIPLAQADMAIAAKVSGENMILNIAKEFNIL